jgi:gliding motility-associated-like protein
LPLEAAGENITWYSDSGLTKKLAEGNIFAKQAVTIDALYVTQRIGGCESKPEKVLLKPGGADYNKVYVANVITPNGDYKNDTFTRPEFPEGSCIGDFKSIHIYNRWGKLIYESRDTNFVWGTSDLRNGVYYYSMHYSNFSYRGSITVLY